MSKVNFKLFSLKIKELWYNEKKKERRGTSNTTTHYKSA